eukprot:10319464-Alexandrium_andersonii.AAC.1
MGLEPLPGPQASSVTPSSYVIMTTWPVECSLSRGAPSTPCMSADSFTSGLRGLREADARCMAGLSDADLSHFEIRAHRFSCPEPAPGWSDPVCGIRRIE